MKKVFSNSIYIIANWSFHDSKVRIKNKIGLLPSYREFSTLKTIIYMYKYVQGSLTEKKNWPMYAMPSFERTEWTFYNDLKRLILE